MVQSHQGAPPSQTIPKGAPAKISLTLLFNYHTITIVKANRNVCEPTWIGEMNDYDESLLQSRSACGRAGLLYPLPNSAGLLSPPIALGGGMLKKFEAWIGEKSIEEQQDIAVCLAVLPAWGVMCLLWGLGIC